MAKNKLELIMVIYYNTVKDTFETVIPDQSPSKGTIHEYTLPTEVYSEPTYIKYLEIHSHHSMAAKFSSSDDKDEMMKDFCYYTVLGKIQDSTDMFTVDSASRIWTGQRFVQMSINDVFEMPNAPRPQLKDEDYMFIEALKIKANDLQENKKNVFRGAK